MSTTPDTTKVKETPIEQSLRTENTILHRQLDEANEKAKKVNDLQAEVDGLKQQLSVALYEESRLKGQAETLQKQLSPDKTHEVKINLKTQPADIEKLLADGWINLHMEFSIQGELRTVWKRENQEDDNPPQDEKVKTESNTESDATTPEAVEVLPIADIQIIANEGFKPLPDTKQQPEPVNAVGKKMTIDVQPVIHLPELGSVGNALLEHGADTVLSGMDAMVGDTLAGIFDDDDTEYKSELFKSPLLEAPCQN